MNNGIFGSNIYALNPTNDLPVARWKKKSMFQSASKNITEMASMLASSAFSSQSAGTSASRAISENQRKLVGPYCRQ